MLLTCTTLFAERLKIFAVYQYGMVELLKGVTKGQARVHNIKSGNVPDLTQWVTSSASSRLLLSLRNAFSGLYQVLELSYHLVLSSFYIMKYNILNIYYKVYSLLPGKGMQ